jgi:hypothetical protein
MLKKAMVVVGVIIAVWLAYRFLLPTENGKAYVEPIEKHSQNTASPCAWSGFVLHKKADLLQVFLGCNISSTLSASTIGSQDELTQLIHTKVVTPLLGFFPEKESVVVTFIAQVQKDAVICVDVKKKTIINSAYDSYDNYCWPP